MHEVISHRFLRALKPYSPLLAMLAFVIFPACTTKQNGITGPVIASLVTSTGHCTYTQTPTQINTLSGLDPLSGRLGTVVRSEQIWDYSNNPEPYENMTGTYNMDTYFTKSGGKIYPLDYPSLAALNIYGVMDQVYSLYSATDASADLLALTPNTAETKIVYQAKRYLKDGSQELETDNASYQYVPMPSGGSRNYVFVLPAGPESTIPLGLNPFVVAHETGHFVSRHLWRKKLNINDQSTLNVVGSIDEGMSDYVGFMITNDPGGFLCSFPTEDIRDMASWKTLNDLKQMVRPEYASRFNIDSENFPIHYGGSIFAAIQYAIGQSIGDHRENFRSLVKTFANLPSCAGNTLTFNSFAACHLRNMTRGQQQAAQYYSQGYQGAQ